MPDAAKPKRGRPATGRTEQVWGRVSVEINDRITECAERLGISKAQVVATLINYALDHEDQVPYPRSLSAQQELPLNKAS
jgi:hypothetical protein